MNEQATVITIGLAALTLLGFVAKLTFPYFMKNIDKKDAYIQQLTVDFRETINKGHQVQQELSKSISAQTEVFKQIIKQNIR